MTNDPLDNDILNDPPAPSALEQHLEDEANENTVQLQSDDDQKRELPNTNFTFDEEQVDLRGSPEAFIRELLVQAETEIGGRQLDDQLALPGTWSNMLYRELVDPSFEERRIQTALSKFSDEEKSKLTHLLRNAQEKVILRDSPIVKPTVPGETKKLTGTEALLAFTTTQTAGGYRVMLYNSGICIDILAPTGIDIQTMLTNCSMMDKELGSSLGGHYFAYSDSVIKTQVLNFLSPLIVNSSFVDWRSKGRLWSVIKMPDLAHIVAALAAICYPNGYENFAVSCKRPISETHKELCGHIEKMTVDIFKLCVTRFSAMSADAIEHMQQARVGSKKHTLAEIEAYQAALGFDGEKLTINDMVFTMKVPSVAEHLSAGAQFLADITNEISADNSAGREEQIGFRYIRSFLPWVASVERKTENGGTFVTDEPDVIVRVLEMVDHTSDDDTVRNIFQDYIGRTQLTYIGHPTLPCKQCGYQAETPSGLWTIDPFGTFFTLAFLYLKPSDSLKIPTV